MHVSNILFNSLHGIDEKVKNYSFLYNSTGAPFTNIID